MKLGIFHKVFVRSTLEESLDGVQAAGLEAVQLDLTAAGIDPAVLTDADCERIRVVIDWANLFHAGQLLRMREVLDEAFDLLGDSIRLAHAKDLAKEKRQQFNKQF